MAALNILVRFSGSTTPLKDGEKECKFEITSWPELPTADDDVWLANELFFGPQPQTDVLNNHYFRLQLVIRRLLFSSADKFANFCVFQIYCGTTWKRNQANQSCRKRKLSQPRKLIISICSVWLQCRVISKGLREGFLNLHARRDFSFDDVFMTRS